MYLHPLDLVLLSSNKMSKRVKLIFFNQMTKKRFSMLVYWGPRNRPFWFVVRTEITPCITKMKFQIWQIIQFKDWLMWKIHFLWKYLCWGVGDRGNQRTIRVGIAKNLISRVVKSVLRGYRIRFNYQNTPLCCTQIMGLRKTSSLTAVPVAGE